jgi:hypothetical protein
MRTKTLLIAAAALVAGVISSNAQIYSVNDAGTVSIVAPGGGTYLLAIPFNIGVSNGANEIWPLTPTLQPTLPDYSSILIWDPNTLSYTTYISDSTSGSLWDDSTYAPLSGAPTLPVGEGFFLLPSSDVTLSFVGQVAVDNGTSNKVLLASGGTYLVGSAVPYGGAITNGNNSTGGVNLDINGGLPDYSSLLTWDPNGLSYTTYISDSTSGSLWDDSTYAPLATPPTMSVGQGVFLLPSDDFNWTVGL